MSVDLTRFHVNTLTRHELLQLDGQSFLLYNDDVDLPCRLKLLPGAKTLFVMLNGAVDRSKTALPVFARWNYGKILGGHVLSVCDPTLYLNDKLRLGWFVGNRSLDPMQALLHGVDAVSTLLDVVNNQVIFYGSSGGGFASMVAAASRECGRAIVINPQTEITAYYQSAVNRVASVFAPEWKPQECRDRYPLRWSALMAIAESRRLNRDLLIVYAQNLVDTVHHDRHFLPFCEATGSPHEGGLSEDGRMLTHVYSSAGGHGPESPEVVKYIVAHGLKHLDGQQIPSI